MMLFRQWRQKLTLPSDQTIEVRSNLLIKSLKWLLLKWLCTIERHQVYKEVNFNQSFTPSLWLVKITCCWKIHLSYSPRFYEQLWLQERTWKDQLQRKDVSYRISFSKFVPSEFNLQLPTQLISRQLRLTGLISFKWKACETRARIIVLLLNCIFLLKVFKILLVNN